MLTPSAIPPLIKIALYRSTSIGDVILATACIDLLQKLAISAEITWIGRKPALQLIASAFPNIRIIEIDPGAGAYKDRVLEQLQDSHFLVDLQANLRSQLLSRALKRDYKIPSYVCRKKSLERVAMTLAARLRGRRRALPSSYAQPAQPQFAMMTDALKEALRVHLPTELLDGLDSIEAHPILPTAHDEGQKPWQKEMKFGRWLAIAPGAAHDTKKVPAGLLQATLELLKLTISQDPEVREQNVGLLFVGNDSDRDDALGILNTLDWPGPLLNLAGKLSLWETALALKEADGLLCNDSGLLHLAEAVGVPVATWFGPTVEAFGFAPWRRESKVFSANLGCRPCSKHGQTACRFADKLCFQLIQPAQVVEHLQSLLKRKGKRESH